MQLDENDNTMDRDSGPLAIETINKGEVFATAEAIVAGRRKDSSAFIVVAGDNSPSSKIFTVALLELRKCKRTSTEVAPIVFADVTRELGRC